jgi:hypothetical protein
MAQQANQLVMKHVTAETADRLRQTFLAGHPVTTELIVTSLIEQLRDESVVADLARRSLYGENALGRLVRSIVTSEAEQMAHATLAAVAGSDA